MESLFIESLFIESLFDLPFIDLLFIESPFMAPGLLMWSFIAVPCMASCFIAEGVGDADCAKADDDDARHNARTENKRNTCSTPTSIE